jgi:Domain of unknown function (DUF397)
MTGNDGRPAVTETANAQGTLLAVALEEIAAASYADVLTGGGSLLTVIGAAVLKRLGIEPEGKANVAFEADEVIEVRVTWGSPAAVPGNAAAEPPGPVSPDHETVDDLRRALTAAADGWQDLAHRNWRAPFAGGAEFTARDADAYEAAVTAGNCSYALAAVLKIAGRDLGEAAARRLATAVAAILEDGDNEDLNGDVSEPRPASGKENLMQDPNWVKSSSSMANGNSVEAADLGPGAVGLRDSKNPQSPHLVFTRDEWTAFLAGVKAGEFDGFGGAA